MILQSQLFGHWRPGRLGYGHVDVGADQPRAIGESQCGAADNARSGEVTGAGPPTTWLHHCAEGTACAVIVERIIGLESAVRAFAPGPGALFDHPGGVECCPSFPIAVIGEEAAEGCALPRFGTVVHAAISIAEILISFI